MALRNQPYFPLYVQDFLTDEKLNSCSAASQGVYIKILCIFHKQETYGKILFKQKDKQTDKQILNFAMKFAKLLPFDTETILNALTELVEEGVLTIDGDEIYQKRMVKDGNISLLRSKAGKHGGGNPILYKQTDKQTDKQNTEYEYAYDNEIDNALKEGNAKNSRIPTKDQVKEYFENKSYPGWEQFYNHYDSQNWLSGNSVPIANWRSKAEVWNKNQGDYKNGNNINGNRSTFSKNKFKGNDFGDLRNPKMLEEFNVGKAI